MINITCIFILRICRQLNLYDFLRLKKTKQPNTYYHLSFLRGRRDLLSNIKLLKIKGSKKHSMMIEEPDFDRMEAIAPVDEDDRKKSSTQVKHPRRRDEE
mmetsp:Transcript_7383/g.9533  ORF Transcript_7383/g.9533 Transcript_7383/m.9533 type:complete len:100 (+) Transcript_7383:430-729(+)